MDKYITETSVPIHRLLAWDKNPRQNRDREMIAQMAASLATNGQFQPLLVIENSGLYYTVDGETRRLAFMDLVAQKRVSDDHPVRAWILPSTLSEKELLNIALAGNTIRRNLNPIEECDAFASLLKSGMTERQIAEAYGISDRVIRQRLALSNLIEPAKNLIRSGRRSLGWAQAMTCGTAEQQKRICDAIAANDSAFPDGVAVRADFRRNQIPVRHAIFNPAILADKITADLFEPDNDHFHDAGAFWEAQRKAISDLRNKLLTTHKNVEVYDLIPFNDTGYTITDNAAEATAVIILRDDGSVEVIEKLLPPVRDSGTKNNAEEEFLSSIDVDAELMEDGTAPSPSHRDPEAAKPTTGASAMGNTGTGQPGPDSTSRPMLRPSKQSLAYLSAQATVGMRNTIMVDDRLAKELVIAATISNTRQGPSLRPIPMPDNRSARTSTLFETMNINRQARDSIFNSLGLAKARSMSELMAILKTAHSQQIDILFRWCVAEATILQADRSGADMATASGVNPMLGWRVEQAYLDTLSTPEVRQLALETGTHSWTAQTARRLDLEQRILKATNPDSDNYDPMTGAWLPHPFSIQRGNSTTEKTQEPDSNSPAADDDGDVKKQELTT